MDKIIAYCGLVCTDCPAYIATQADDRTALEQVAAQWQEESVLCDGCLGSGGRKCSWCAECEIRACGVKLDVVNCAHCSDYACDKLEGFFDHAPDARATLDEIRRSL